MRFFICFLLLCASAFGEGAPVSYIPAKAKLALFRATSYTLLSLAPEGIKNRALLDSSFEGYEILGQAIYSDRADMQVIRDTLLKNVAEYDDGDATCCFNPRHGIRVLYDGSAYDFVICYECTKLMIHRGDEWLAMVGVSGSPEVFNRLLTAQRVRLAPPAIPDKPASASAAEQSSFLGTSAAPHIPSSSK